MSTPPKTWDELIADCTKAKAAGMGCYAGQFANYEGLTVNATEAINTAGGEVVKEDGKTPNVDTPEAKKGLDFLVNGFKQGYIPKDGHRLQGDGEPQRLPDRQAAVHAAVAVRRVHPQHRGELQGQGQVRHRAAAGLRLRRHAPGASSLGGHSWAMSVYGKHKATAIDFMKFSESDAVQKYLLTQASLAPVTTALYTDPTLVAKAPYLPTLLQEHPDRGPSPGHPVLPSGDQGDRDQRVRGATGAEVE